MEPTFTLGGRSRIYIGPSDDSLRELLPVGRVIALVDATVAGLYPTLVGHFEHLIVESGEQNKTLHTVGKLCRGLLRMGADRSTFLLGIGGGVVTDLVGFVAATYMRGVHFGFLPTTLLGQIDASVGGKNGVNLDRYKNMIGTILQPDFVVCDPCLLATLSDREFRAGVAEAIKAGIIGSPELFDRLEESSFADLRCDDDLRRRVVTEAVGVKVAIVGRDEREAGERRLLNLGHTMAHAIEKCAPQVNHGEAVAMGLGMISRAAVRLGVLPQAECTRITALLERLGFCLPPPASLARLMRAVAVDKKHEGDTIHVVLPATIGCCEVRRMTSAELYGVL